MRKEGVERGEEREVVRGSNLEDKNRPARSPFGIGRSG